MSRSCLASLAFVATRYGLRSGIFSNAQQLLKSAQSVAPQQHTPESCTVLYPAHLPMVVTT